MKYIIFILFCTVTLVGCKSETMQKTTSAEDSSDIDDGVIENFDCESFFKKGNYSSLCFIDAELPESIQRGCIYSIQTNGDKQNQDIKIQFTDKKSIVLADMHLNMQKSNYKKGNIILISTIGDAAFFDVHRTEQKSESRSNKDLHVRYKNICFKIMATYQSITDEPCFYSDHELIAFSQKIIDNL